MQLLTLCDREF